MISSFEKWSLVNIKFSFEPDIFIKLHHYSGIHMGNAFLMFINKGFKPLTRISFNCIPLYLTSNLRTPNFFLTYLYFCSDFSLKIRSLNLKTHLHVPIADSPTSTTRMINSSLVEDQQKRSPYINFGERSLLKILSFSLESRMFLSHLQFSVCPHRFSMLLLNSFSAF